MTQEHAVRPRNRPRRAVSQSPTPQSSVRTAADSIAGPRAYLEPLLIAAALLAGLAWSWGKWPDVIVDFGRELYVPWRLNQGDALYRDIAYFHGPLSPYFNAVMFQIGGTSLRTLAVANFLIAAGMLAMLYPMIQTIAGRGAALLAGLTFVGAFAFAQLEVCGNSNWICPYAHEMTHGITLSLGAIYLLDRYLTRGNPWLAGGSGLLLGLTFLTKGEIFVAAALAVGLMLAASLAMERRGWKEAGKVIGLWGTMAVLPAALAFGLLATQITAGDALVGTIGSWAYVFDRTLTKNVFYQVNMGTDVPWQNLGKMAQWSIGYGAMIGIAGLAAYACRRWTHLGKIGAFFFMWWKLAHKPDAPAKGIRPALRWRVRLGERPLNVSTSTAWRIAVFAAVGLTLWLARNVISWSSLARPWPLFLLALALATSVTLWRQRAETELRRPLILRLTLIVFSLGLLSRMMLNARIGHYGFGLAMPATLLLVAAGWQWLPTAMERFGCSKEVFRAAMLAAWLMAIGVYGFVSNHFYGQKTHVVGSGGDQFLSDARGWYVAAAVEAVEQRARPGETLAVMPEGMMLNYLCRRTTATRYLHYIPTALLMYGEDHVLSTLVSHPPDWLVQIHRDDRECGPRFFGVDYGLTLGQWIRDSYQPRQLIGAPPFVNERFGILVSQHGKNTRH